MLKCATLPCKCATLQCKYATLQCKCATLPCKCAILQCKCAILQCKWLMYVEILQVWIKVSWQKKKKKNSNYHGTTLKIYYVSQTLSTTRGLKCEFLTYMITRVYNPS